MALSCESGRVTDSLLNCSDWGPPRPAAVGPLVVAEGAAWAITDPAGEHLFYRSGAGIYVKRVATGEERSLDLAENVYMFLGGVDGGRLVAFYSDRSVGFEDYVLIDALSCTWRSLGINVSTTDPTIGYTQVSAMSLGADRLFYAIGRGTLEPSQEFLLDLSDGTRLVADASAQLVSEARLEGNRAVWLQQKHPGAAPGVVSWSYLDGSVLSIDLPSNASPAGLSVSGDRAVWTDSRQVYTAPPDTNIFMLDLVSGTVTQLTFDRGTQDEPSILGHLVAWSDGASGNFDIRVLDLDTGEERVVAGTPENERLPVLTAAGIFWQVPGANGATVWFDASVHP